MIKKAETRPFEVIQKLSERSVCEASTSSGNKAIYVDLRYCTHMFSNSCSVSDFFFPSSFRFLLELRNCSVFPFL